MLENAPPSQLRAASDILSARYRAEVRDGRRHLDGDLAVRAYLAARLPATYAAARAAMGHTADALPDFHPVTLLDIGAGPGTSLWAADDSWGTLRTATLVEASRPAVDAGMALCRPLAGTIEARWLERDIRAGLGGIEPADLVTATYVLDELEPDESAKLVDALWALADKVLLVVEPGTPAGHRRILEARDRLVARGGFVAAPCPHEALCPLRSPDWCHFAQRVARSRVHRLAKGADVPWEDEKFSYVVVSRGAPPRRASRVLAPPVAASGRVTLKLCEPDGKADWTTFSRRQGGTFKVARRLDWGDIVPIDDWSG